MDENELKPENFEKQFDDLCKHIVIAKSYSILGLNDGENVRPHGVSREDDFPWPVSEIPELTSLADKFDRILVRSDGFTFEFVCIKNRLLDDSEPVSLSLDSLKLVGLNCLKYTGEIHDNKMPVKIQVWEVSKSHVAGINHLQDLHCRAGLDEKINITSWSLSLSSLTVWSNAKFNGFFSGRKALEKALYATVAGENPTLKNDFQIGMADQFPLMTFGLIGMLVLIFVTQLFLGEYTSILSPTTSALYELGGLNQHAVMEYGQWYRMYSAAFLHAGPLHLLFNCVALFFSGLLLELWLGRSWLLTVFSLSLLGGSAASLLINGPEIVSVGASGAIMGMLAAAFMVTFRLPYGHEQTSARMNLMYWLIPALIPLVSAGSGEKIDFAAHFGGAMVGFIIGAFILKTWKPDERFPSYNKPALGVAGTSFVFIYLSMFQALSNGW